MKQKRYWLRGGVIGLIFGSVLVFVYVNLQYHFYDIGSALGIEMHPTFGRESSLLLIYRIFVNKLVLLYAIPVMPFNFILTLFPGWLTGCYQLIFYMISGLFLGWIYGKIKNKKLEPSA